MTSLKVALIARSCEASGEEDCCSVLTPIAGRSPPQVRLQLRPRQLQQSHFDLALHVFNVRPANPTFSNNGEYFQFFFATGPSHFQSQQSLEQDLYRTSFSDTFVTNDVDPSEEGFQARSDSASCWSVNTEFLLRQSTLTKLVRR